MISIIVAIDEHNAIGRKGQLLCHLPNDLKHFKNITSGHTVIMGKNTYLSLPKRPLPNRTNIVITDVAGEQLEGATMAYSIDEALQFVNPDEEAFIIGGGMIYRQFMENGFTDKLYITHIDYKWDDADTFFPAIDPDIWLPVRSEKQEADEKNPYTHHFVEYIKQ